MGCDFQVFSAHAEVVPIAENMKTDMERILRARGGSSSEARGLSAGNGYSPRTRR